MLGELSAALSEGMAQCRGGGGRRDRRQPLQDLLNHKRLETLVFRSWRGATKLLSFLNEQEKVKPYC